MAWYFRAVLAVLFATLALQASTVVIRHFFADEHKQPAPQGAYNTQRKIYGI